MNTNLRKLSMDIYNGVKNFSMADGTQKDANDVVRELILDKCNGTWSYRNFERIKNDVFEIIEEMITVQSNELTRATFEPFTAFKEVGFGELVEFELDDDELFEVSVIANGHDNLYRQRIINNKVSTKAFDLGVAIYNDMDEFMMGKIDWTKLVDRCARSLNKKIAEIIGSTFASGYDSIRTDLKTEGAMDESKLVELCQKVGKDATIYGTKLALSKIPSIAAFPTDASDVRTKGYVQQFRGVSCVELENHYDKDSKKWALANDTLYIVPSGGKVVCVALEGDAWIIDDTSGSRKDRQIEYSLTRRIHVGLAVSQNYGAYKINA